MIIIMHIYIYIYTYIIYILYHAYNNICIYNPYEYTRERVLPAIL